MCGYTVLIRCVQGQDHQVYEVCRYNHHLQLDSATNLLLLLLSSQTTARQADRQAVARLAVKMRAVRSLMRSSQQQKLRNLQQQWIHERLCSGSEVTI